MMETMNKAAKDLTNKDLNKLMKPLKRKGDPSIPTKKNLMLQWYEERKDRTYSVPILDAEVVMELAMIEREDDSGSEDESGEEAFLSAEI